MKKTLLFVLAFLGAAFVATPVALANHHESAERVFELRIYHPNPGKLDDLLARFRDHTCAIFERVGIENIGYWVETEPAEGAEPKLYYVIAHASREAARENWRNFLNDEEWKVARAKSEENGRLVAKVDSIFLKSTDFSGIK